MLLQKYKFTVTLTGWTSCLYTVHKKYLVTDLCWIVYRFMCELNHSYVTLVNLRVFHKDNERYQIQLF